jgi:hypothetical protein
MPDDQPQDIVLHLLRDIRERIEPMATKGDIGDLRSELNSGLANVAADFNDLRKDLSDQIIGLRRAVVEYHSAVIGHGNIIAELEARVRRVEQHLGLDSH